MHNLYIDIHLIYIDNLIYIDITFLLIFKKYFSNLVKLDLLEFKKFSKTSKSVSSCADNY